MLASFALVDLAKQARVGEQLCKKAEISTIPGELKDKALGMVGGAKPHVLDLLQASKDSLGDWGKGMLGLIESGLRNTLGRPGNDVNFKSDPADFLVGNLNSIDKAQATLGKSAPGVGAVGGGLIGAGLGAGAAKLLQGKPEDEEDEKTNRLNMILAALAGGGLGALGGGAASTTPLIQEKLEALGRSPAVRGGLETGANMYGDAVTKLKELMSKLTAGSGTAPAPAAGAGGPGSWKAPGLSAKELLGL
jgi:hypothetical protein